MVGEPLEITTPQRWSGWLEGREKISPRGRV